MLSGAADGRISREKDFHNQRFGAPQARKEDAFYFAIEAGARRYWSRVQAAADGADALEYGCASGGGSVELAPRARSLVGIDISDVAIGQARAKAAEAGASRVEFRVEDAERMSFANGSFDLVFGSGILHHLDLDRAIGEIRRVLRPRGRAIFWEPLGHNAAINLYRTLTPHARSPDEHPLRRSDLRMIEARFGKCDLDLFGLSTLASIPLRGRPAGRWLRSAGERLDDLLLRVPGLRWQAWYVLIDLEA